MANEENDSAEFKTGLFGIKLAGKDSLGISLFIAMLALAGLTFYEHSLRAAENKEITCMIKLNLFVNQQPRSEMLDWSKMPVDLYSCVPKFLYDRGQGSR